jgi:dienelactone hydrolase
MNRNLDFTIVPELNNVRSAYGNSWAAVQACAQHTLHRLCTNVMALGLAKKRGAMVSPHLAVLILTVSLVFLWAPLTLATAGVQVGFSLESPTGGPFPSDLFTVPDPSHNTGLRVNLPSPDCAERPSDCDDIAVINTLDGFNVQPRLSIPFSGPIDVNAVTSDTVFLISLGSTLPGGNPGGQVIGINQVVWDPATNTLYAESDELLDQHTRYALIVTKGVHDTTGAPVQAAEAFARFRHDLNFGQTGNPALKMYRKALLDALAAARAVRVPPTDIVAASVFTTQSVTAILEKIRDQLKADIPEPADFLLGSGETRTVFPLSTVAGITFNQQVGAAPSFEVSAVPLEALELVPGVVGHLAFGKYWSPDYETPEKFIPPIGTRSGIPTVQGMNEIFFNLILPAGSKPSSGWPVAIVGHGGGANKNNLPFLVAATLAEQGIATIAINAVGNGGGSLSTLTVDQVSDGPVTFPAGGRGIDLDGDGIIFTGEGRFAAGVHGIIGGRDGIRQTVVDLMQLVRVIEVGMDVDGDSTADLDSSRISYSGISFGGMYGTLFLALEPDVHAGVLHVPGGPDIETFRLSPPFPLSFGRLFLGFALAFRVPSLINVGGPFGLDFDENLPLRNQPPVANTVPGAIEIQKFLERVEWVQQAGDPIEYAAHLRKQPLDGVPAKSVIIQFAKGDQSVQNPTTTAMLRAGDLADRATYYRHDLAFAANPALPKDPHGFQVLLFFFPAMTDIGLGAQQQVAEFLASDGHLIIDPDGAGPLFEVPIVGPLPEELNFIP